MQAEKAAEIHKRLCAIAAKLSPALADAIAHNGPIEFVPNRKHSFPEHLCRAVTGQQLSIRAAQTIWARVVASAGDENLIDYFSGVEDAVLKSCGLSAAKVKTVKAIAQAAAQGQLDSTELSRLSHRERTKRLIALWGVGPWTADMMGIFYFGDENIWPDGDLAARRTLEQLTSKRRKTVNTAARFVPYRTYLALHMWQYTDATP